MPNLRSVSSYSWQTMYAFKTILIPVDFSINTEVAVAKALDVADEHEALIYLLHVKRGKQLLPANESVQGDQRKLEEWKHCIEMYMPSVTVQWKIAYAEAVQKCIQEVARNLAADLVVVGKSTSQNWLPFMETVAPVRIAEHTQIPVLTVRPGALHTQIKTVVVPIVSGALQGKMDAIRRLCKRGNQVVHLVAFQGAGNDSPEAAINSLLHVYQWVRETVHCNIEYELLQSEHIARGLLAYAAKVKADMLLVYPELETKIDIWNRHIPDVLPYASKMQVLAVHPAY